LSGRNSWNQKIPNLRPSEKEETMELSRSDFAYLQQSFIAEMGRLRAEMEGRMTKLEECFNQLLADLKMRSPEKPKTVDPPNG
jgi:hypothetical protein